MEAAVEPVATARSVGRALVVLERHASKFLCVALLAGIAVRLWPLVPHAIWGSDSGEYYALTLRLVEARAISFEYEGWGLAYPYFPAMFVVVGAVSATTGLDVLAALQFVVPILAAIVPVGVALVAHAITRDARVAVVTGLFLAVAAPHVIVTSHAMPGSLGHVFLVAFLLALVLAYRDRRALLLALPLGAALVLTHHLSSYFLVGAVAATAFVREIGARRTDAARLRLEVTLAVGLVFASAFWWLAVAEAFRDRIVGDVFRFPWYVNAAVFLAILAALPLAVAVKRYATGATWTARLAPFRIGFAAVAGSTLAILATCSLFVFVGIPGTTLTVTWLTIAYVLPPAAFIAFALVGAGVVRFEREGNVAHAWLAAILASLAFSLATGSHVLFPYRHVDYLLEPVAIAAAAGFVALADVALRASRSPPVTARTFAVLLSVLLIVGAAMSQPPRETVGGFEEGMSDAELAGVLWARDHLPPKSTIAADHRDSSLLFGLAGLSPTWDETVATYHAETADEAIAELAAVDLPTGPGRRVDYVFLSKEIRAGVTLKQWENSRPMSDAAWEKFFTDARFERLYADDAGEVYVFRVVWG